MNRKYFFKPNYSDYVLFGFTSSERDYTLCWHLNQILELSLSRVFCFEKQLKDQTIYFPVYIQHNVFDSLTVYLFTNFKKNTFFHLNLKPFHYMLVITSNPLPSQKEFFFKKLQQSPKILMVKELLPLDFNQILIEIEIFLQKTGNIEVCGENTFNSSNV